MGGERKSDEGVVLVLLLFQSLSLFFFKIDRVEDFNEGRHLATLPEIDFTNYSVGDTINMEYVDPAPKNAYYLCEHVSMDDVLEGERHIRLSKGEENGLDTTDNPSDGQIQQVDGEGHSTL